MTRRLMVFLGGLLSLALLFGASEAAEISIDLEWTEPTFENIPTLPLTQFKFTRIRWSPVACINQPPPGIREELRGTWTYCGFHILKDVPANTPVGGERRTTTVVIPDANLAWSQIVFLFHFAVGDNGMNYFGYQDQEVTLTRTPTGELVKPPITLSVSE